MTNGGDRRGGRRKRADPPQAVGAAFVAFLGAEERGSASIWNLFWFCGFALLLGLGIDTTAAMNTKAKLQSVADAAAHAAVIDVFPVTGGVVGTAISYAGKNISTDGVVTATDVTLGYWNADAGGFQTGNVPFVNAVRVVAGRESSRDNALGTSFLRLIGFYNWDISAASVATYHADMSLVDRCRKNGLFAGGKVHFAANNIFTGEYCIHGETGFHITRNNLITCDVEMSTADPKNWHGNATPRPSGSPGVCNTNYDGLSSEQMIEQVFVYRSIASRAEAEYQRVKGALDAFVAGDYDNDPFNAIPPYLTRAETISGSGFDSLASAGLLAPGTLYVVQCGGGGSIAPQGLLRNVGIYTDCDIKVGKGGATSTVKPKKVRDATGAVVDDLTCDPAVSDCSTTAWQAEISPALTCESALALGFERYSTLLDTASGRTYRDGVAVDTIAQDCAIEPGASGVWDNVFIFSTKNEGKNPSSSTISFPSNMQIGRLDACAEGGGVRVYAAGSMSTPAGARIHGSHFVLLGDAKLAEADGTYGLTIEAAGDIQFAAQGEVGGCSPDEADLASDVVITVRPISIVN